MVPFTAVITYIPVYGEVHMTMVGGVSAKADGEANFDSGASASATLTIGAYYDKYASPSWRTSVAPFLEYTAPTAEWNAYVTAEVKGWVRPEMKVVLYKVLGPYIGAQPYIQFDGAVDLQGWSAGLLGGIDADIGIRLEIFDSELADFNYWLEGPQTTIWGDARTWDPLTITTISLPSGTVSQTYSAQLEASGSVGGYTWSLSSGNLRAGWTYPPMEKSLGRPLQPGSPSSPSR